jgi:hypothetical protein
MRYLLSAIFLYLFFHCYSQPLTIVLHIDSIIPNNNSDSAYYPGECTLKYDVINNSRHDIYFLNLSISYNVYYTKGLSDSTPPGAEEFGFGLNTIDSSSYEVSWSKGTDFIDHFTDLYCGDDLRGVEFVRIPLNMKDTLNHIVLIKSKQTFQSKFYLYGCGCHCGDSNTTNYMQESLPLLRHYNNKSDRKKFRIQLYYNDTRLRSHILSGKKIWVGKLKSKWINEE